MPTFKAFVTAENASSIISCINNHSSYSKHYMHVILCISVITIHSLNMIRSCQENTNFTFMFTVPLQLENLIAICCGIVFKDFFQVVECLMPCGQKGVLGMLFQLCNWCFEASQPQRIATGLRKFCLFFSSFFPHMITVQSGCNKFQNQ